MCVCVFLCVCVCVDRRVSVASATVKRPVIPLYVEDGRCTNFPHYYSYQLDGLTTTPGQRWSLAITGGRFHNWRVAASIFCRGKAQVSSCVFVTNANGSPICIYIHVLFIHKSVHICREALLKQQMTFLQQIKYVFVLHKENKVCICPYVISSHKNGC